MSTAIDTGELDNVAAWLSDLSRDMTNGLPDVVMEQTLATALRVKSEMPVDTGRAAGSWWEFTGGGDETNPADQPADTIHEVSSDGLSTGQGTRVPYVAEGLNAGSSKQAPAGFIDAAAEDASIGLESKVNALLSDLGL